jgi:leader peptidase (prepilin peptidase) / N-methyltransferase
MPLFFYLFFLLLGLIVGSFLNSVTYRLDKGESFVLGRSYCPNCRHQLYWLDLVPLFSFIFLLGQCRYCKKKISWQYPIVELATGILFVLIFQFFIFHQGLISFNFQNFFNVFYLLIASCLFIIIFVYDLKHYLIPDGVVYSGIILAILFDIFYPLFFAHNHGLILQYALSGFFACLFFLAIFLISKGRWMGFGDVKLSLFMGFFLGYPKIIVALFLAFFTGAIIGVGLIILKKKKISSEIPFGPFLVAGTFLALFLGGTLIKWYLGFLLI